MSVVRAQTRRRWLIMAAVVAMLCALPAIISALPAGSIRIALPTLAARIAGSARQPYQGYAVATGSAALPSLPELDDVVQLFNGDTSLRIWYGSPQHWRMDTLSTAGERDVYQTGSSQTIWDSGASQLTTVLGSTPARLPRSTDLAPPDLARRLLAAAVPNSTVMSALPARRIGGITAAGLRLTPSDPRTTIGHVDIWADPRTGLPVEVTVTPTGAGKPILISRMLDVSTTAPSAATTTIPRAHAGIGSDVTSNPDVYTTLKNLGLGPLPKTLAGMPRIDRGLGALPGIAAYGVGFRQIIAISVYGKIGTDAFNAAKAVGVSYESSAGSVITFKSAQGGGASYVLSVGSYVVVPSPLLTVLVVRPYAGFTEIVAGFVTPDVLKQAGEQLMAAE